MVVGRIDGTCGRSVGRDANGDPDAPDLCFICRKGRGRRVKRTFAITITNEEGIEIGMVGDLPELAKQLDEIGYVGSVAVRDEAGFIVGRVSAGEWRAS